MPRNYILMRRLPALKKVRLPNGRTFYSKYVRVPRRNLSPYVRIARAYIQKTGQRRQRKCRAQRVKTPLILLQAVLLKAFDIEKRAGNRTWTDNHKRCNRFRSNGIHKN